MRYILLLGLIGLVDITTWGLVFAQGESIAITTYYPAPYGVYRDLEVRRNLIVGEEGTTTDYLTSATTLYGNVAILPQNQDSWDGLEGGRLGIGITTPEDPLHIDISDPNTNILPALRLQRADSNSAGANGLGTAIDFYLENDGSVIDRAGRLAIDWISADKSGSQGRMRFYSSWNDGLIERMRLNDGSLAGVHILPDLRVDGGLDIDGGQGLSLPDKDFSVGSGDVYLGAATGGFTGNFIKLTATGAFNITAITIVYPEDTAGRILTLYNKSNYNMTIVNEYAGGTPEHRILTLTGGNITTSGTGAVNLIYDGGQERWIVTSWQQ